MLHQIAVKGIIVREGTLLALYSDEKGQRFWDLPGGRLEFGEDMETAMIREGREELGCTLEPMRLLDTWDVMKNDTWQISGVFYLCRLAGDASIVLSEEHTGYTWLPIGDFSRTFTARTLLERMQRWDWDRMLRDAACFAYPVAWMSLKDLVPNNLYLNGDKLARLRELSSEDFAWNLPPVTVSAIDGRYALIDGHSRAYAAHLLGLDRIRARVQPLDEIDGSAALYRRIHAMALEQGIADITCLADRILDGPAHRMLWVDFCEQLHRESESAMA